MKDRNYRARGIAKVSHLFLSSQESAKEEVTIQLAAKTLNVSKDTVITYLNKGLLTRISRGDQVYLLMDEVRALRDGMRKIDATVEKDHYKLLSANLGQPEDLRQYLLQFKAASEAEDNELQALRSGLTTLKRHLETQASELERSKTKLRELEKTQARLFAVEEALRKSEQKKSAVQRDDSEVERHDLSFAKAFEEDRKLMLAPFAKQIQDESVHCRTYQFGGTRKESRIVKGSNRSVMLNVEAAWYPKIRLHIIQQRDDKQDELDIEVSFPRELWLNLADVCKQMADSMNTVTSATAKAGLNLMSQSITAAIEAQNKRLRNKEAYEYFADFIVEISNRTDLDKVRKGQMVHDEARRLKLKS